MTITQSAIMTTDSIGAAGEKVAHHQAKRPSAQEAYTRIERDERDDQIEYAPEDEVRIHQVARLGYPPAGPPERQYGAQDLEAGNHKHYDGREGEPSGPVRHRTARRAHGIAYPSRHRFAVLRHRCSPLYL